MASSPGPPGPSRPRLATAAAVALLVATAGCQVGQDRLGCTLDPGAIVLARAAGPVCGPSLALAGRAFDYGRCGAPCPPAWTVVVTWRNLTTGDRGQVPGTFQTTSCWPFFATACSGADFSATVPLDPGVNRIELEADEGDGFSACQAVEVERLAGC